MQICERITNGAMNRIILGEYAQVFHAETQLASINP
jgi:hypothetical protein